MKILKVIHGYPPDYSAGSEVYSQTLCHELARQGHEVRVFTREELSSQPDVAEREEPDELMPAILVRRVNMANHKDRYVHPPLEAAFIRMLEDFRPEVVHFGHLNHLSMRLPELASARGTPCIFTIHDFWMMCPRGQFIQMENSPKGTTWPLCSGQESEKCADRCYKRYCSGSIEAESAELAFWTQWVDARMKQAERATHCFDMMIAPSRQIMERFAKDWPSARGKMRFIDYGYNHSLLSGRKRTDGEPFTFGYIGTHIPAKGIGLLMSAFAKLSGSPSLRIWGYANGQETVALKRQLANYGDDITRRVEWLGGYRNGDIVTSVLNRLDCIVVPSVWLENSPLVIHESQQARVPVITADAGGMGEFVVDGVNGLTFSHRDADSLADAMRRAIDNPHRLEQLGRRGYLFSESGDIPTIESHITEILNVYEQAIARRASLKVSKLPSPWRITFDTNPDDCNLSCIMCEDHSPHSQTQSARRKERRPKRRMDIELIRKVLEEQAPLGLKEIIPSTMGEPLLYKDFEEVVNLCRIHGVKMNLTTNGTFPGRGAEAWAKLLTPICSDVKISWNGGCKSTQEKIMRGTSWEENLENLRTLVAVRDQVQKSGCPRCRVTLQLTFMEANLEELPDIIELALKTGVDRVKGHHLWAHFKEIEQLSLKRSPDSILRWNKISRQSNEISKTAVSMRGFPLILENFEELNPSVSTEHEQEKAGPCPFLGKEAWVNAQGRFDPCCCPDLLRRTLGDFGNVSTGLQQIWSGDDYSQLLSGYLNRQVCRTCNMRRLK